MRAYLDNPRVCAGRAAAALELWISTQGRRGIQRRDRNEFGGLVETYPPTSVSLQERDLNL